MSGPNWLKFVNETHEYPGGKIGLIVFFFKFQKQILSVPKIPQKRPGTSAKVTRILKKLKSGYAVLAPVNNEKKRRKGTLGKEN